MYVYDLRGPIILLAGAILLHAGFTSTQHNAEGAYMVGWVFILTGIVLTFVSKPMKRD